METELTVVGLSTLGQIRQRLKSGSELERYRLLLIVGRSHPVGITRIVWTDQGLRRFDEGGQTEWKGQLFERSLLEALSERVRRTESCAKEYI
jgi:hypothetical protein